MIVINVVSSEVGLILYVISKRKSINFTPVIAHNMAGYDNRHICTIINKSCSNKKFSVIPTTDEKFISFTFPVWVNSFMDKNG